MRWWWMVAVVALAAPARADNIDITVPSVMDKPWSVYMGYGPGVVVARSDDPTAFMTAAVDFGVRRRLRSDLELSLSLAALVTRGASIGGMFADLRYRILAEATWNPFVYGGVAYGFADGTEKVLFLVRAGIGIECRCFESVGLTADLSIMRTTGDDMVNVRDDSDEVARFGAFGAGVTVSATYYWGRNRARKRFVP